MDDMETVEVIATCRTEGCASAGYGVLCAIPADPVAWNHQGVVCGACSNKIDDVQPM